MGNFKRFTAYTNLYTNTTIYDIPIKIHKEINYINTKIMIIIVLYSYILTPIYIIH